MPKTLKTDERVRDTKDFVFDILEKAGIASFEVEFNGEGDSGQIEGISLDEKLLSRKIKGCKVKNGTRWDPTTQTSSPVWENDVTLQSIIESVCYDILGNFGGWEINEGSYGTFNFDVKERKAGLTMNERVADVNTSEYKF